MKKVNFSLLVLLLCTTFSSCKKENSVSLTPKTRTIGFEVPTLGIPITATTLATYRDNFEDFIDDKLFAKHYTISNTDLTYLKNNTNCGTVAIYNGLINAGSYAVTNRVCIVVPVDNNYHTIPGVAMLNGNLITQAVATLYINNFKNYLNRDVVRGVLVDTQVFSSTLQLCKGLRVYHVLDGLNQRGITMAQVDGKINSGLCSTLCDNLQEPVLISVHYSRVCPNNCDVY